MARPYTHGFYKNTQDIRRDRMTSYKRRRLIAQVMHRINHPKTDPYQGYAFDLSTFSPSKRPVPNSTLPYPWKKKQIVNDNIKSELRTEKSKGDSPNLGYPLAYSMRPPQQQPYENIKTVGTHATLPKECRQCHNVPLKEKEKTTQRFVMCGKSYTEVQPVQIMPEHPRKSISNLSLVRSHQTLSAVERMMMPAQSLTVPVNTEFGRYSESVMSNSTLSPRNTPTYKSPVMSIPRTSSDNQSVMEVLAVFRQRAEAAALAKENEPEHKHLPLPIFYKQHCFMPTTKRTGVAELVSERAPRRRPCEMRKPVPHTTEGIVNGYLDAWCRVGRLNLSGDLLLQQPIITTSLRERSQCAWNSQRKPMILK